MNRQSEFQNALLDADLPAPQGLHDGHGRPAARRFDVYRNNVAASLTNALETAFPATSRLLGPENFRTVAGRFLRLSPPDSPLMMHYGTGFADFLAGVDGLASMGYLPDIARLEQALRRAYHAADHLPLAPDALARTAPEALPQLRFTFAPSVHLLISDWPVLDIYRYALSPEAPKPRAQAQAILLARNDFDPVPHLLPHQSGPLIHALMTGETLGNALAASPDCDLSAVLSLLLSANAVASLNT